MSSGMPWRKWGHWNRLCGVNEVNHADPTVSPLHLTCYSFQLENSNLTVRDDFIDIPPGCLWTPTLPWTHPTRGLVLKQSSYTYVHFKTLWGLLSTLPSSFRLSSFQTTSTGERDGWEKRGTSEVYKLFVFLLLSIQWEHRRRWLIGVGKKRSWATF